jgi:hypothetical protein
MPEQHRPFSDFDPDVRACDIAALHDLVTGPINEHRLSEWVSDSLSRKALLSEVAIVTIRWAKSLGQPRTPTFASAFTVTHDCWVVEAVDTGGGGIVDKSHWAKASKGPLLFPGGEDGDDYVVPVLVYPIFFWQNRLRVELTAPSWDSPPIDLTPASYKVATPARQDFRYLRGYGPPVVLEDVRVVEKPLLVFA